MPKWLLPVSFALAILGLVLPSPETSSARGAWILLIGASVAQIINVLGRKNP